MSGRVNSQKDVSHQMSEAKKGSLPGSSLVFYFERDNEFRLEEGDTSIRFSRGTRFGSETRYEIDLRTDLEPATPDGYRVGDPSWVPLEPAEYEILIKAMIGLLPATRRKAVIDEIAAETRTERCRIRPRCAHGAMFAKPWEGGSGRFGIGLHKSPDAPCCCSQEEERYASRAEAQAACDWYNGK